jgi:hypothetical protein
MVVVVALAYGSEALSCHSVGWDDMEHYYGMHYRDRI